MSNYSAVSRPLATSAFGLASREMDELFDRLFTPSARGNGRSYNGQGGTWAMPLSIWEQGDQYHVELDLPGFDEDRLEVSFEDGELTVTANRELPEGDDRKYLHNERFWGESSRSIRVPESVDPESIEATYNEGTLHLTMSKRPEVLPKKITISTK